MLIILEAMKTPSRYVRRKDIGHIHISKHAIKRCMERIFDTENKKADPQIVKSAIRWLKLAIRNGVIVQQYIDKKGKLKGAMHNERIIKTYPFIILLNEAYSPGCPYSPGSVSTWVVATIFEEGARSSRPEADRGTQPTEARNEKPES